MWALQAVFLSGLIIFKPLSIFSLTSTNPNSKNNIVSERLFAQTHLRSEADSFLNQGLNASLNGDYQNAIDLYRQSAIIYQKLGDQSTLGYVLKQIGSSFYNLYEYDQALENYQQSLIESTESNDVTGMLETSYAICLTHYILSKYADALTFCQNATEYLEIVKNQGKQNLQAYLLHLTAILHTELGQHNLADILYQRALQAAREEDNRASEGSILSNLGLNTLRQGDYQQAVTLYQQAIDIHREVGDTLEEGRTLNKLGEGYHLLGQYEQGVEILLQALNITQELQDWRFQGVVLDSLGSVYADQGEYQKALSAYQEALVLSRLVNSVDDERIALSNLGDLLAKQENIDLAIIFYKAAVNIIEDIRSDIENLSQNFQESYTVEVSDTYRQLADLLLQQGRILEAQHVLELLKVEELREFTRATYTTNGIEYDSIEQPVINAHGSLIALGAEIYNCGQNCPQTLIEQQIDLEGAYTDQVRTFRDIVRRNRGTDDVFYDPTTLGTDALDLVNAQSKTALIYPFVKDDDLWLLWVATGGVVGRVKVNTINNAEDDLNRAVLEFRQLLNKQDADSLEQLKQKGNQLYNWLITPLAKELEKNDIQQLIFAQDRTTRYLPMAALYDGEQFLIERYTVSTVLSAALTNTTDRLGPVESADTLALGLQKDFPGYPALPNVREELDGVVKTDNNDPGIYPGQVFMDDAFNFDTLSQQVRHHRILHIATHAEFVPHVADASYILSGQGEQLTIAQLGSLGTQFNNLHLVVLSACQTALGGEALDGTEIAGVSSYFLGKNKAEAVMATLWKVDDEGTSILMQRFYELMASGELTKAEALKHAQLSLLNNEVNLTERFDKLGIQRGGLVNADAPDTESVGLSHPYYWAPFILIGNSL
ncbi:MAG: CHAT domain-containing protein [Cyanobacteria bacterium P01_D01_bin.156]